VLHYRSEVGMLRATEKLRAIQMRHPVGPTEPDMRLGAGNAGTKVQREAVIGATLGDLGIKRRKMKRPQRLVLHPDIREDGALVHLYLEDRIVQIETVAE